MTVHVRTTGGGAEALVRTHLARLDPDAVMWNVRTMTQQVSDAKGVARTLAVLSTALAGVAVFLATIGMYGMMTTLMQQRRRELCIHAAVGAAPRDILRQVSIDALRLTVFGLALGIAGSLLTTRPLTAFLYDVRDRDPRVFAAVAGVMLVTAIAAWLGPARRAARSEPLELLRDRS
jgi:ABC-type antimicrobial peptide transport system permease subunit